MMLSIALIAVGSTIVVTMLMRAAYKAGQVNAVKRVDRILRGADWTLPAGYVLQELEIELGIREAPPRPTGEYDA